MVNYQIIFIVLKEKTSSATLFEATLVENACMQAILSIKIFINHQFGRTETLSSTKILCIVGNFYSDFFLKKHQMPNIKNFTKDSVIKILISPNTLQRPQITPNTNFVWLFGALNVKACLEV